MSQNVIIAILGTLVVVGGGAWYYQTNVATPQNAVGDSAVREADRDSGGFLDSLTSGAKNFTDFLGGSDSFQCKFSGIDPDTKESVDGEMFVDGESYRMRANTVLEGKDTVLNMITHEQVFYMWSDDETAMPGLKIDVSMFDELPEEEKPESPIEWLKDPELGFDSDCRGWSPRSDSFEPPADVEFIDMFGAMGAMFGEMMQEGGMGEAFGEGFGEGFGEEGNW